MRGARPNYKPSSEHLVKLGLSNKNRVYDKLFRDTISERFGFTVYVYDVNGNLLNTYSSIIKFKQDNGIKLHHKTIYNYISQGKLVNGLRVKLAPLQEPDGSTIKYNCTH